MKIKWHSSLHQCQFKINEKMTFVDELGAYMHCFNEHKTNFHHCNNHSIGSGQLFNCGEVLIKAISGSNQDVDHARLQKHHEGCTGQVTSGIWHSCKSYVP